VTRRCAPHQLFERRLPHLRGRGYGHAPAVAEPLPERLELLRPSLLGTGLHDPRRRLGKHRNDLADAFRGRQEHRLAERRRSSAPLERQAVRPLVHRGRERLEVDLAPELERHRHGFADPPARIRRVATQLIERSTIALNELPSQPKHSRESEEFLRPSGRRLVGRQPRPATKLRRGAHFGRCASQLEVPPRPGQPRVREQIRLPVGRALERLPVLVDPTHYECGHDRSRGGIRWAPTRR
jgi:hypothetical protein